MGGSLSPAVQAFLQLLLASQYMEEEHARETLNLCAKRFDEEVMDFEDTLIRANQVLRDLDFEIFGIRLKPDSELQYVVANTMADNIAKQFGSSMSDQKIAAFRILVDKFAEVASKSAAELGQTAVVPELSANDLHVVGEGIGTKQVSFMLDHAKHEKWIVPLQNGKKYILGPRSYVELSELMREKGMHVPQILHY